MEHYNTDYTISLIYSWLKENKLLKTCKSLEAEYGNKIHPPGSDTTLNKIIETYQAMSLLMSAFVQLPVKKTSRAVNPRKRKTSKSASTTATEISTTVDSTNVEGTKTVSPTATALPTTTDKGNKTVAEAGETSEPAIPKKKRAPLAKPGEWICPQMEKSLCDLYDRLPQNALPLPVTENISNAATISLKETDKVHDVKEVIDDQPITKMVVDAENVSMFTSDSDSDSDNENSVPKQAVIKTSKVVPSPLKKVNLAEAVASIQGVNGEDASHRRKSKIKKLFPVNPQVFNGNGVIEEKKSGSESNAVNAVPENQSSDTGHMKKKKKKHKINATEENGSKVSSINTDKTESLLVQKNIENGTHEEDSFSQDSGIGMSNLNVENSVKKKKKKHKLPSENDVLNQSIVSNSTVEEQDFVTEKKKKKKQKANIVDNDFQKLDNEKTKEFHVAEDHNKSPESVKKKKKKVKLGIETPNKVETVVTEPKSVSTIENSESLNNLGNILKKKKKKKHVDIGS